MVKDIIKCIICSAPGEIHHVWTRKSFPEFEHSKWNHCPLCRICHRKWHDSSTRAMSLKHPAVNQWLKKNGWYFDPIIMRYQHAKKVV